MNPITMVAPNEPGSNTTQADGINLNDDTNGANGSNSAKHSDNLQISHANPTECLLASIVSGSVAEHTPAPASLQRKSRTRKTSLLNRKALIAEVKTDIRLRFKLTDATFELLPLAKTLAAVQILTKLANRTVKQAKQDESYNEQAGKEGKNLFSPLVVQAYAPKKTHLPLQIYNAEAYETVPELVHLTGSKQAGNVLLAICHFYNAAVTRAGLKLELAKLNPASSTRCAASLGSTNSKQDEIKKLRKRIKRLNAYVDNQFPDLITIFDLSLSQRDDPGTADLVNKDFFIYIVSKIGRHDTIKENGQSGRIDLNLLFDVVAQAKQDISSKTNNKEVTARASYLRNPSLNAVVTSFILAYMKMERNFFRERRVRARVILLQRICCLSLLVKFKVPGYSVEFGKKKPIASPGGSEDGNGNEASRFPPTSSNRVTAHAIGAGTGVPDQNESTRAPETSSGSATRQASNSAEVEWFRSLPKTRTAPRVKLTEFDDCIIGADQGFPIPLEKYCNTEEESHNAENEIKDANKTIFMQFQNEHPEFTVCFKFKKFVVPGPATNEAMRANDFENVPTVDFISKVDLLHVAREYLMHSLGCTTAAQSMSVHENAMYTIISFARSLLAVTKDYLDVKPEGSEL